MQRLTSHEIYEIAAITCTCPDTVRATLRGSLPQKRFSSARARVLAELARRGVFVRAANGARLGDLPTAGGGFGDAP